MNSVSLAGRAVSIDVTPARHSSVHSWLYMNFVRRAQGQSGPGMVSGDFALETDAEGVQQLRIARPDQLSI